MRQRGGREGGREGRGEGDGEGCRCAVGGRFRGLTRAAGAMSALPSALRLTCCCCWLLLTCLVVFLIPAPCTSDTPRQVVRRIRERPGGDDDALVRESSYLDDTDVVYDDEQIPSDNDDIEDWFDKNITAGE